MEVEPNPTSSFTLGWGRARPTTEMPDPGNMCGPGLQLSRFNSEIVACLLGPPLTYRRFRLGFLTREISLPEDFDRMGAAEIEALFESRG